MRVVSTNNVTFVLALRAEKSVTLLQFQRRHKPATAAFTLSETRASRLNCRVGLCRQVYHESTVNVRMCILFAAAVVLTGTRVPAADITGATNREAAAVAAVSGGGRVTPTRDGYMVLTPRGHVRWTRSHGGVSGVINGQSRHLRKTYDGYALQGGDERRVTSSYDGLLVSGGQAGGERWFDTHNGTYRSGGITTPVVVDDQLARYIYFELNRTPTVKRMKNSRPSAFRRWPPVEDKK